MLGRSSRMSAQAARHFSRHAIDLDQMMPMRLVHVCCAMGTDDPFQSLLQSPVVRNATDRTRQSLRSRGRASHLGNRETLVLDRPMFVAAGRVKLSFALALGGEHTVSFHGTGDFLYGEPNSVDQTIVTPMGGCSLISWTRADFAEAIESDAKFAAKVIRVMMHETQSLRVHATMIASLTACERVASFLTLSSREPDNPSKISLSLSRSEMADYLNLTIETTSRCITRLRSAGLIACPSRNEVTVLDEAGLAAFRD